MFSNPADYDCPNCGSTDTHTDPTRDLVGCADCKYQYTESELIEWERTGDPPEPFSTPNDRP